MPIRVYQLSYIQRERERERERLREKERERLVDLALLFFGARSSQAPGLSSRSEKRRQTCTRHMTQAYEQALLKLPLLHTCASGPIHCPAPKKAEVREKAEVRSLGLAVKDLAMRRGYCLPELNVRTGEQQSQSLQVPLSYSRTYVEPKVMV